MAVAVALNPEYVSSSEANASCSELEWSLASNGIKVGKKSLKSERREWLLSLQHHLVWTLVVYGDGEFYCSQTGREKDIRDSIWILVFS